MDEKRCCCGMSESEEQLAQRSLKVLRELCAERSLPTSGKKAKLVRRLLGNSAVEDATVINVDEQKVATSTPKNAKNQHEMDSDDGEEIARSPRFTFHDIGDSLEKFSGDRSDRDVREWLDDFEQTCDNFGWQDVQKFVYGRRLLKGTAKLFVSSSSGLNNWASLRAALEEEFEDKVTSAEIHELLRNRKKKSDESYLQYIYHMQNIAKRGKIEEEALCDYVVRGIVDDPVNKVCLFGATEVSELKNRVQQYEKMKSQMRDSGRSSAKPAAKSEREKVKKSSKVSTKGDASEPTIEEVRCYNCGNRGHYANDCDMKSRGPKCFVCSDFGHRAKDCKQQKEKEPEVNILTEERMPVLQVTVGNNALRTLFDTGSRYNLICESAYKRIGEPPLTTTPMVFSGFGAMKTRARGKIVVGVCVDAEEYPDMSFYVVPAGSMSYDAILGMEALNQLDAEINKEGVKIKKKNELKCDEESEMLLVLEGEKPEMVIDVSSRYADTIRGMIENYVPKSDIKSRVETKIILNDDVPVHIPPRRFAPKEKAILEKTIDEWLKAGVIKESVSEYASPVTLAPKKNGSMRVCVDYRQLNQKVVKDCFPMRNIEDQVDNLKKAKVFTTLDLKNSFFHVPVEKSSQKYTSFVTHAGQYEFLKTPFGFCNSPASFSRFVADVFRDLIRSGHLIIYVDDAIIRSETEEKKH